LIKKRIGIIDIGTNTFNLLIVVKTLNGFEKIYSTKEGVGLGLGGINEGVISQATMDKGLETLKRFVGDCDRLKVDSIKALGTSMVRDAKNKNEFLQMLKEKLNIEVEAISGDREANLIYRGVKIGYPFEAPTLIMDIGGGSTEFIFANTHEIVKSKSFDIGTARIYQMFDFEDPYSQGDIERVINYLEENTKGFFDEIETDVLIGASGSFETFYAILYQKEYPENNFEEMKTSDLNDILDEMIHSTQEDREANSLIIPIRKKMAPIAAIKIKWILNKLNIATLTISPFAMKEGVINEL
jgi:exopolyphosphatase / guanosine-5'-triphosphate,3'-diphosphate pyrophosphatase